jgi:hypothetical protein
MRPLLLHLDIARRIGPNAVIAKGFDSETWSREVSKKYLGENNQLPIDLLPALLLTDAHPDDLKESSLRLLVPLQDAKMRCGGSLETFFNALSDFSLNRNPSFLSKFEEKSSLSKAWSAIDIKPNFYGIGINLKEGTALIQGK